MECRPEPSGSCCDHDTDKSSSGLLCALLLVGADRRWTQAVHAVASELGGNVSICGARDAVGRLASSRPHYSHLLLNPASADGLLDDLVRLTSAAPDSATELLLLGSVQAPPRAGVIRSASRRSVRQALAPRNADAFRHEQPMELSDLRSALNGAMIETRYQPIVRMADRKPIALEALVRLNHPAHGTLAPDDFVPQVEDAGLAAQLTELVADRALQDMANEGLIPHGLGVTLNFPLDVLLVPDALRRLDQQRRAVRIPADRVVIELTESRPVKDLAALRAALEPLRAAGYSISIDDVSPSVPQAEALLDLPFTSLKLDKTVVQRLHDSPDMLAFARHILALAATRKLSVVAEGVEDVATWKRAEALGIDHAQGFLVARPLPANAVPIWLEAWRSQPAFG